MLWPGGRTLSVTAPGTGWFRFGIRERPQLLFLHIPTDPDHVIAAHDGVHRIRLAHERLPVRAEDLGAREIVPAALAIRVAVDHPHCGRPSGVLAGLRGYDARRGRVGELHV